MDNIHLLQHFVESSILSKIRTQNPIIDGIITAFILSISGYAIKRCASYITIISVYVSNLWLLPHGAINSIEISSHDISNVYTNTNFTTLCWYITYVQKCNRGELVNYMYVERNVTTEKKIYLTPRDDVEHFLTWKNHEIKYIFWKRGEKRGVLETQHEGVTLYTSENTCDILIDFLQYISLEFHKWKNLTVWTQNIWTHPNNAWRSKISYNEKLMNTVILDGTVCEDIVTDMSRFLEGESFYKKMGLSYKRGYIFSGPPGCGKTSLIKAMSFYLKMDIYMINLNDIDDDNILNKLFQDIPQKSMVVLEDIDCMSTIVHDRERTIQIESRPTDAVASVRGPKGITLSCLLNILDGITTNWGQVVVMTTNHIEKLDPALIRPGRCDMNVRLGLCSRNQIQKIFKLYFDCEIPEKTLQKIRSGVLSPASIGNVCISNRFNKKKCLAELVAKSL